MKSVLILFLLLFSGIGYAQEEVKWLSLEEAEKLNKEKAKPFIIDFYTDWCGWCKHMDKTTYADGVVASLVNRYFYPVRVNAESSDTLNFRGKIYPPVKNENKFISGLAIEMLGGKLAYPTTVFIYDKEKVNLVVPGYIDVPKMQGFLIYFTENAYLSTDVNAFLADFEAVFGANAKEPEDKSYWTNFKDLENKRKEKSKKVLLFLNASWSNSSKMMERTVFSDSLFSALAQKYFYCLHLDVQSQDTLTFATHKFGNAGESNNHLHQLAIALSDKVLRVPSIYIFDEDEKLMEQLYFYLDKDRGRMILDFLGSGLYKEMSWQDYVKIKSKEDF